MAVVARFFVRDYSRHAWNPESLDVVLAPVTRGAENKAWATATPSGEFRMTIQNEAAAKFFLDRLGKELAITIEDRPDVCVLCSEEVTGAGPDVGVEVNSGHLDRRIPNIQVGDVAHNRCIAAAWQNSN